MPLVEWAALLPFPSQVLTYGSGFHFSLGDPTVLAKSCFSALFVVIAFLLSVIMLFIVLNPRSRSALLGERASMATINLFSWSEMLLPPLALNLIYARWVCCLLRRRVPHKLFTSSPKRGFSWSFFSGSNSSIWPQGFCSSLFELHERYSVLCLMRREEPFFHIVSYSPNKLSLIYYWASFFSQFSLSEWHFFCMLSQHGMLSRGSNKAFYTFCILIE